MNSASFCTVHVTCTVHCTVQLREQCKKKQATLALQILRFQHRKRWDPVNSIPHFLVTKRLRLRFKKNTAAAAAAEPNGLESAKQTPSSLSLLDHFQFTFITFNSP